MKLSDYTYRYSAAAHLAASDKYPDGAANVFTQNTAEGFDALCWMLAELSTQGELMNRYMGHEKKEPLTIDKVRMELMPYQLPEARKIVMDAIIKGLRADADENAEVDVVLEELQKKTGRGSRKRST